MAENTIIVYTSDNGPEDYHVGDSTNGGVGSPGLGRGRKRSAYEGGVRVPCIVRWPGKVPAGNVSDTVWSGVDLIPTLASITGVTADDPSILDGEDVSDIWQGAERARVKDIFWEWKYEIAGNEDITAGSGGNLELWVTGAATPLESFSVTTSDRLVFSGPSVTIDPTVPLEAGKSYHVRMHHGAIVSAITGENYGGIFDGGTWNFTTIDSDNNLIAKTTATQSSGAWSNPAIWNNGPMACSGRSV